MPNPKEQNHPDPQKRVAVPVPYELRARLKKRMKGGSIASVIRSLLDRVEDMEKREQQ